jgi:hypothetical protein
VPAGWATWTFWQYTDSGRVPGIVGNVDLNRFCCDPGSLAALAGAGGGAGNPFGTLESANRVPGGAVVSGWAIDPDTTGSLQVHFYADGRYVGAKLANGGRADVGAAYPGFGPNHGIDGFIELPSGTRRLCAYAINVGSGGWNPELGCVGLDGNPIGTMDSATGNADGVVRASGWALDPDTLGPIDVHVYVADRWGQSVRTTQVREDVRAAYPGAGPTQGWTATFGGIPAGSWQVCAYAINVSAGTRNPNLGCRTVVVPQVNPLGSLDAVTPVDGAVRLRGWAIDVDTPDPIDVHVYVDGAFARSLRADVNRPDLGFYFGGATRHGFDTQISVLGGRHQV